MGDNSATQNARVNPPKLRAAIARLTELSYLVSVVIVGTGIWLLCMRDYECEYLLRLPKVRVFIGIALLVIFAAGSVVVHSKAELVQITYLGFMSLMILMFILGMALAGLYPMESRGVPGSPVWLKKRVSNTANWANVKSCIYDAGICSDLAITTSVLNSYEFSMKKLSPIESGCCKPPTSCGMHYVNATFWIASNNTNNSNPFGDGDDGSGINKWFSDSDCDAWSNDFTELCYDCLSCKEGYLSTLRRRWSHLGIILTSAAVVLTVIHSLRFVAMMMLLRAT